MSPNSCVLPVMSCQEAPVPSSLLLSVWHSSCSFRRGGCLVLCLFLRPLSEVSSGGEALTALYNRSLCSCSADKTFGHSITSGVAGRTWFQVKGVCSGQDGEYHYLHKSPPWCDYSWGWRSVEVEAFAFSFLLLVPKWIDYVWDNRAWRSMLMLMLKQTFILQH